MSTKLNLAASIAFAWNSLAVEKYAARKKNPDLGQPSLFETSHQPHLSGLGPGRWITIHGENHGGHHVFVGNDGKMKTGAFSGKSLDEAFAQKKAGYPPKPKNLTDKQWQDHVDGLRAKAKAHDEKRPKSTITDVTPAGYGPDEGESKKPTDFDKRLEDLKKRRDPDGKSTEPVDVANRDFIPLRDRSKVAGDMAKAGKTHQEIADFLVSKKVATKDALKLAMDAVDQNPPRADTPEKKENRPSTYWRGDRAEFTGKTENLHGGKFYEIEMMEGHMKGQTKVVSYGPGGDPGPGESNKPKPKSIVTPQVPSAPKPGIVPGSTSVKNEDAKAGDQLGLFGEGEKAKPKPWKPSLLDTKGKQGSLFDTKGDKDQKILFDDGVTPEDMVHQPEQKPDTQEKAASAFDDALDAGKSPRQAADASQKQLDADYEFARASEVRNAGEDLKGSARRKVNAWKGLDEAEKDGTAAAMVTRDQLAKLEPTNFVVMADKKPFTSLAMHYAMRAFPAQPGTGKKGDAKKDREQFLQAYRDIKSKAEELASNSAPDHNAIDAVGKLREFVKSKIESLRSSKVDNGNGVQVTDRFNQTANDLVKLHSALITGYRANKTGVANRLNEFAKAVQEKHGTPFDDLESNSDKSESVVRAAGHAKDLIEGHSLNKTFGRAGKSVRRFDPAEVYVKVATRKGGRDLSSVTSDPNKATKHMVGTMGLRGVQWGNTVTDEERKHHAAKAVEALTDLADTLGLHPNDIALEGKLGLAIGARGKGLAAAHYEPGSQVINLTRANGVGTLAHEWGHGFDHMLNGFGLSQQGERKGGDYMSEDLDTHEISLDKHGRQWKSTTSKPEHMESMGYTVTPRPKSDIRKAYQAWNKAAKPFVDRVKSQLREDVKGKLMSDKKAQYWSSHRELFARAFERHVQHKLREAGNENTYLSGMGGSHPYWPSDEENKQMAPAFDKIFEEYRKHKHGSPAKVKFSRREANQAFVPLLIDRYGIPKGGLTAERLGELERYAGNPKQPRFPKGTPGGHGGEFTSRPGLEWERLSNTDIAVVMSDDSDPRSAKYALKQWRENGPREVINQDLRAYVTSNTIRKITAGNKGYPQVRMAVAGKIAELFRAGVRVEREDSNDDDSVEKISEVYSAFEHDGNLYRVRWIVKHLAIKNPNGPNKLHSGRVQDIVVSAQKNPATRKSGPKPDPTISPGTLTLRALFRGVNPFAGKRRQKDSDRYANSLSKSYVADTKKWAPEKTANSAARQLSTVVGTPSPLILKEPWEKAKEGNDYYSSDLSAVVDRYWNAVRADDLYLAPESNVVDRYDWNSAQHPRNPAGNSQGGEFRNAGASGGTGVSLGGSGGRSSAFPSTKKRDIAEVPGIIKQGHHLHLSSLSPKWKNAVLDWNARMHGLLKPTDTLPATVTKLSPEEQFEQGWRKVDKNAVRQMLAEMNDMDRQAKQQGIPLDDFVNANKLIPRGLAERLDGGARFFMPENLRGRIQAKSDDNPSVVKSVRDFSTADRSSRKAALENDSIRAAIERAMGLKPSDPNRKPSQPDTSGQDAQPEAKKIPTGLSKQGENKLDGIVNEVVGDGDQSKKEHFKQTALDAWKQMKSQAEDHNDAMREIMAQFTKKGHGGIAAALARGADPTKIRGFDEMVDYAAREFPHIVSHVASESESGSAEEGLIKALTKGIQPVPQPWDDEVIDQAMQMVGPHFFEELEPAAASGSDDWDSIPFSVRADIKRMVQRYWVNEEMDRYSLVRPTLTYNFARQILPSSQNNLL
ncbi:MAG: hypothetical protein IT422_05065 [Pirellulaceae bacterium]|nr:hypothetical protein [Pirellulaceae bacterium]